MKYEVVKGCVIHGANYQPGAVVDLDDRTARTLLGIGRVVPFDESQTVDRSVGLETSEERPRRRGRPPKNPVMEDDDG